MAILNNILKQQLINSFRNKSPRDIAEAFLIALNKNSAGVIADFEKGESIEKIKKKWLLE